MMTSYNFPLVFSQLHNVCSCKFCFLCNFLREFLPVAAYVGERTKSSLCLTLVKLHCLFSLSSLYLYQNLMASICNASIITPAVRCVGYRFIFAEQLSKNVPH